MFGYSFHLVEAISLQFKRSPKKHVKLLKCSAKLLKKNILYRCFLSETYILGNFVNCPTKTTKFYTTCVSVVLSDYSSINELWSLNLIQSLLWAYLLYLTSLINFSILYNSRGKVSLFDLFFWLCDPKKRENVNSFAACNSHAVRSHEGSSLLSFIAVAWSWKLLWRVTHAKLLKYSMYSSGKSEKTTNGQRVSKKRMHCASLCCMAIELKGFVLSILGKMKEGDVLMLTVVVSLLCRLVSDCIFAVGECISSRAVVLPVNFEHVRSDIHNDFQAETDTLVPLSKLPTTLWKLGLTPVTAASIINFHQRYGIFVFRLLNPKRRTGVFRTTGKLGDRRIFFLIFRDNNAKHFCCWFIERHLNVYSQWLQICL